MSQPATVSTGTDRRTIGVILRTHGYVTDAQLDDAADEQARTGKPLGQVLVEAGTITRLELASALAEPWSDSSEWMHTQDGAADSGATGEARGALGLAPPRHAPDDGVLAARLSAVESALQDVLRSEPTTEPLEHAVADLARRLTTWEPTLSELERRADTAVDADALESQLSDLSETIETALRRTDATAGALADLGAKIEDLHNTIGDARDDAERVSATTSAELAQLSAAIEAAKHVAPTEPGVGASEIAALHDRLAELAQRPTGDPELRSRVDDLIGLIDAVAARPVGDPDLADRVDRMSQLVSVLTRDSRVDDLKVLVTELASRPVEIPELTNRLDDLSRRVDALVADAGGRVDGEIPDELRTALEELATRPPVDAALAARVEELAHQIAELPAGRSEPDHAQAAATAELSTGLQMLSDRLGEVERTSDTRRLVQTVEELSNRPIVEAGLGDRVWRLAERIDALADAATAASSDRSHETGLAELRATVESLANRPAGAPDQLDRVDGRLDDVVRQMDDLARSFASLPEAQPAGVSHELLAEVEARIEAQVEARVEARVDSRLADLPTAAPQTIDIDAISAGIEARLQERLVAELAARPDAQPTDAGRSTDDLAADLARNAELWYAGRAALEARLEGLEARVAARPAPVAASTGADGAELNTHVYEQEVERVLMAVERLGLHLSEHDRALAELMSRRGTSKVEELAARIDELETYGVAAGAAPAGSSADGAPAPVSMADTRDLRGELRSIARQVTDLEDSSKTDREKFLTQLERMASSIDWRIRRIESGETA